jgi:hypothetical protein
MERAWQGRLEVEEIISWGNKALELGYAEPLGKEKCYSKYIS